MATHPDFPSPYSDRSRPPSEEGPSPRLLLDAGAVAQALSLSVRKVREMDAAGQLPQALKIGRAKRWRAAELAAWVAAGMPRRADWAEIIRTKTARPVDWRFEHQGSR